MAGRLKQYQIQIPIDRPVSVDEIEMADRQAGGHFFDANTMRGFRSRILSDSPKVGADKRTLYFITSERFVSSSGYSLGRTYSVRVVTIEDDGDLYIRTAKGGDDFDTPNAARKFMASDKCP